MRDSRSRWAGAVLLLAGALGPAAPAEGEGLGAPVVRLELLAGGWVDVGGPVERRDGLILFRDARGLLCSVRARHVAAVRPLPTELPTPPAASGPSPEPTGVPSGPRFSNADLPPPLPSSPPPESTAGPWPAEPELPSPAPPTAAEPTRRELAVERTLRRLDELAGEIGEAERERNVAYRLMVCAQHGIPPRSAACTPLLRPLPNRGFPSRTERVLAARLRQADERLRGLEAERASLEADARALGVEPRGPGTPEPGNDRDEPGSRRR